MDDAPFKCTYCDAKFKGETAKRNHEKRLHFGTYLPFKPRYYNCEDCGGVYRGITSLKNHRDATHLGIRITCKECGKVFRREDIFNKHLKRAHNKCPVRLECKHCNRSYVNKHSYLAHLLKPRHLRKIKEFERTFEKRKTSRKVQE